MRPKRRDSESKERRFSTKYDDGRTRRGSRRPSHERRPSTKPEREHRTSERRSSNRSDEEDSRSRRGSRRPSQRTTSERRCSVKAELTTDDPRHRGTERSSESSHHAGRRRRSSTTDFGVPTHRARDKQRSLTRGEAPADAVKTLRSFTAEGSFRERDRKKRGEVDDEHLAREREKCEERLASFASRIAPIAEADEEETTLSIGVHTANRRRRRASTMSVGASVPRRASSRPEGYVTDAQVLLQGASNRPDEEDQYADERADAQLATRLARARRSSAVS